MRKKRKPLQAPYQRMLKGLKAAQAPGKSSREKDDPWFLYIVECSDGSLYTGITTNLDRRLKMHNDGKGARFTRSRRPVKMIYHESLSSRGQALIREHEIKILPRVKKQALGGQKIEIGIR